MDEWEDQAHSEVREPVNSTRHHVGSWPGGLQEDLGDEQCGDGTWGGTGIADFSVGQASPPRVLEPCPCKVPEASGSRQSKCVSRTPDLVEKQCETASTKSWAQQGTSCDVPKRGP